MKITINDLFEIPSSVIYNPDVFSNTNKVVINSTLAKKNSIFFAIKGDKHDGHKFIEDAILTGAKTIVINKEYYKNIKSDNVVIVAVDDTTKAFGDLARIYRKKLNGAVIGITGSNGKTTTKDFVSTLLSEQFNVVKTEANNNNHIGVPLTIFNAKANTEILVLEEGTNHFGEIEYIASISLPDFALITNIGESHLEFLKNKEGVYKEKSALFSYTLLNGGKIFVNSDDPILKEKMKDFKNKVTYGFKGRPNVKGKILGITPDGKSKIEITMQDVKFSIDLPVLGQSNASNFLAAVAIALNLDLTVKEIKSAAKILIPAKGRLEAKPLKDMLLIDDTYNSNPESSKAAIELVAKIKLYKNKFLILGDMFELGRQSKKMHESLSEIIIKHNFNGVLLIGKAMKHLHNKLKKEKQITIYCKERTELSDLINKLDLSESVVLIKGSRGMKMEQFVKQIENGNK
ncbi:MAG: UDP-N-acetylmuramoyl-tripeptide--D-alanyl-D-alanine ligase [Melioribacteraceae bacterium]|nr:UDP-N-acetylmuramoyl-tripeptide--D-alanyl-D-alanine ligase [Melioribacteraceae bacterium]